MKKKYVAPESESIELKSITPLMASSSLQYTDEYANNENEVL
jgi:hypothetical protein